MIGKRPVNDNRGRVGLRSSYTTILNMSSTGNLEQVFPSNIPREKPRPGLLPNTVHIKACIEPFNSFHQIGMVVDTPLNMHAIDCILRLF